LLFTSFDSSGFDTVVNEMLLPWAVSILRFIIFTVLIKENSEEFEEGSGSFNIWYESKGDKWYVSVNPDMHPAVRGIAKK
jgi:hypothetical protein